LRSESRSRIEYLIPTNNIIVFDSYFNLTNKSNLIDRLQYDLIRFFDNLVVAYIFGPPCMSDLPKPELSDPQDYCGTLVHPLLLSPSGKLLQKILSLLFFKSSFLQQASLSIDDEWLLLSGLI